MRMSSIIQGDAPMAFLESSLLARVELGGGSQALHEWVAPVDHFRLHGVSPQTFEQLSSTTTNLEFNLATNVQLLANLKACSEVNKLHKATPIKNVAIAEVHNNNMGIQICEPKSNVSLGTYKSIPLSSFNPKGKEKAVVLGHEDEAQPHPSRSSFEVKNKIYNFRKDIVAKLFQQALELGRMTLLAPTRPE